MARALSLNAELWIGNDVVYPLEIGEIGEGEEGRIDVADGGRKYKVRDQIFDIGEVPVTILFTGAETASETTQGLSMKFSSGYTQTVTGKTEYSIMQAWCNSGESKDIYVVYRDSVGVARLKYSLTGCQCAMGKKNAFNRNSKEVDTKKYVLLPFFVEDVTP